MKFTPTGENHYASFGATDHPYVGMVHFEPQFEQYRVSLWRFGECLDVLHVDDYLTAMVVAAQAVYSDDVEDSFSPEFVEKLQ